MDLIVVLGVWAGSVTLVLATVVLAAGRERNDNRLYAGMGMLAAGGMLYSSLGAVTGWGGGSGLVEATMAALTLLFSQAFPDGRRIGRAWWAVALGVLAAGTWLVTRGGDGGGWALAGPYFVAVVVLLWKAVGGEVAREHRPGLIIVAAIVAARCVAACAFTPQWAAGQVVQHLSMLLQSVVIGAVILRYRMLDVRRVFGRIAEPLVVAVLLTVYVAALTAWGPWLALRLGVGAALVAVLTPPMLVAWAGWTWRGAFGAAASALDPHRDVRRELVERVLSVTGYVVDPEAVLAMIQAAIIEVFPEARVHYWRVKRLRLLPGVSRVAPPTLESALREAAGPYVDIGQLVERLPELRALFPDPRRRLLLPVRRDNVVYGAFELTFGRAEADDLLTVAALADHLAVKLENLELSSSLGEAGRELAHVRSFLEDMIESLPVGVVGITGPELRVRLWNPAEEKRTGLAARDVIGKRYLEDVAPSHVAPRIRDAIRQGVTEVLSFPNVGWSEAQPLAAVDITLAPVRRRAGAEGGYVLILEDTAERNALQREVEESRRLAALGKFAAAIAHDIRTPLSSIKMSVQILRSKVELPPEDMEYFDLTLEAISRLARDVDELLDFTKPSFLHIQDTNVREMLEDVRAAATARAARASVKLEVHAPEDLNVPVDEARIRKAMVNLVDNALQASGPGAKVEIEARRDGEEVCLSVKDKGTGIAACDLERIWDPFYTTRPDGVGLGLAIVRKAVTAHGGGAKVTTALGRGTEVELRLPATRATEVVVPIEDYRNRVSQREGASAKDIAAVRPSVAAASSKP